MLFPGNYQAFSFVCLCVCVFVSSPSHQGRSESSRRSDRRFGIRAFAEQQQYYSKLTFQLLHPVECVPPFVL
jgi:hypothetical protein